jgi:hypothetical protein
MRPDRLCCANFANRTSAAPTCMILLTRAVPWGAYVLEKGRYRRRGSAAGP